MSEKSIVSSIAHGDIDESAYHRLYLTKQMSSQIDHVCKTSYSPDDNECFEVLSNLMGPCNAQYVLFKCIRSSMTSCHK